jgi:predicted nucleic acid-binding protein
LTTFADSSALVKLYADEAGHEEVRALNAVAVAQLARVEVPSAFWRKQRTGELNASDAQLLTAEFEADYFGTEDERARFAVAAVTSEILDEAARLCARHGLRSYDAVQLATAMAVRTADPSCTDIAVFDTTLRNAAAAEGFRTIPAETANTT